MQFDLVSPEKKLVSTDAKAVQIPGAEGDFTAMDNHAPLVTTLRPGILKVQGKETQEYIVTGGFVEISGNGTKVLAEKAGLRSEFSRDILEQEISSAEAALTTASDKSQLAKRLGDLKSLLAITG